MAACQVGPNNDHDAGLVSKKLWCISLAHLSLEKFRSAIADPLGMCSWVNQTLKSNSLDWNPAPLQIYVHEWKNLVGRDELKGAFHAPCHCGWADCMSMGWEEGKWCLANKPKSARQA